MRVDVIRQAGDSFSETWEDILSTIPFLLSLFSPRRVTKNQIIVGILHEPSFPFLIKLLEIIFLIKLA